MAQRPVCPACAGMIRPACRKNQAHPSLPRMCGDDPGIGVVALQGVQFAPHVRG